MKKVDSIFTWLLVPLDALMIVMAFVSAYFLRSNATFPPVIYIWPFQEYFRFALVMLPIWLVALALAGLYSSQRQSIREFGQVIVGASLGTMAVVLWVFLNRSDFFSRLIVFYIWIAAIILIYIARLALHLIHANLYRLGLKKKKLVFIGALNKTSKFLIQKIRNQDSFGFEPYGIIAEKDENRDDLKYLGSTEDVEQILSQHKIDEVIVTANNGVGDKELFNYMRACQERNITFKVIPSHAEVGAQTLRFDAFAGIPVIEFKGTPLDSWGLVYKRFIDIIGSMIALIILSPVFLIITLIIKFSSKGPVIYKNIRVGNRGNFITLKFRTMSIEHCTGTQYGGSRAEEYEKKLIEEKNIKKGSAVYKIADDPRVTPIGTFLRKTSLDELPQFVNVFLGNMSIIGPRPHQPREVRNYTKEQRKLLLIKPGITGLAQISGRSDLNFNDESQLDIFYLENWSIWLDFYIMIKTFGVVLFGRGSY